MELCPSQFNYFRAYVHTTVSTLSNLGFNNLFFFLLLAVEKLLFADKVVPCISIFKNQFYENTVL